MPPPAASDFAQDGYTLLHGLVPADECAVLAERASAVVGGGVGSRTLLEEAWCVALARRLLATPALAAVLPPAAVAIQCIYFEKSTGTNWVVAPHQDRSIPVAARVEHEALHGWSRKEGRWYVQPPASVLESLVAVRLHLDPCGAGDGPLRVIPGSHRLGILPAGAAAPCLPPEVACHLDAGDALVLRPLLLHASARASGESRRRVLHFVFGPAALPCGLRWQDEVAAAPA